MNGPTDAYLVLVTGEVVDCLLEQIGPYDWQAVPVLDVEIDDISHGHIENLPGGTTITFVLGLLDE